MYQKIALSDALASFKNSLNCAQSDGQIRHCYHSQSLTARALQTILAAAEEMAKCEERPVVGELPKHTTTAPETAVSNLKNLLEAKGAEFRLARSSYYAECIWSLINEVERKQGEYSAALELGTKLHEKIDAAIASATAPKRSEKVYAALEAIEELTRQVERRIESLNAESTKLRAELIK